MTRKEKLFCIPYAGGTSSMFNSLVKYDFPYEIIPLEYPGHGKRISEELQEDIDILSYEFAEKIKNDACGQPYSILGYSLGSLVAYEVYRKIVDMSICYPNKMFLCAANAPHIETEENKKIRICNTDELRQYLGRMNGTPEIVLNNAEILEYTLPIMQNDIELFRKYVPGKKVRIKSQVMILYSNDEHNVTDWKFYVEGKVKYIKFNAGHFFIHNEQKKFVEVLQLT